jgi:hypothetical protein
MGIIFVREGKPFVLEAASTVRYTPLGAWIERGEGGAYVVKRVRAGLDGAQVAKLRTAAEAFVGRPYDPAFEWSDTRIYCSELVWKIYERALGMKLGNLERLSDFDLSDSEVRTKLEERYGSRIPLDEPVIAPAGMFASPLLMMTAHAGSDDR